MKKLIPTFAVCLAMAASFVSCGSKDSSSESTKKKGIEGKWNMSDETIAEIIGEDENLKPLSGTVEFKDNNKMLMVTKADSSNLFNIKDDKCFVEDTELDIIDFTGTELSVGKGEKVLLTFTRDEKSDDMYGTYDFPMKDNDDDGSKFKSEECSITFEKDGTSYMNMIQSSSYIYDEESKELKYDENDDDPSKAEIDGDKLTITDSDGEVETLTRAD